MLDDKAGSPKADKGKENTDIMQQQNSTTRGDEKTNDSGTEEPLKPKALVDENHPFEETTESGANEKPSPKKRKADDEAAQDDTAASRGTADGDAAQEQDDEDTYGDSKPKAQEASAPFDLSQPIKRARTAYFIFSDEHRAEIQAKVRRKSCFLSAMMSDVSRFQGDKVSLNL